MDTEIMTGGAELRKSSDDGCGVATAWPAQAAKWIFAGESGCGDPDKPGYYDFVLECALPDDARPLRIYVAANSHYQLRVDGCWIGRGPAVGHTGLRFFDVWQLDDGNDSGERSRLAVRLFHEGRTTKTAQEFDFGEPGLLLAVLGADGAILAVSDAAWRCRRSPEFSTMGGLMSQWGNFCEYWHGARGDRWFEAGFDVSGWESPAVVGDWDDERFAKQLRRRETPALTETPATPVRLVSVSPRLGSVRLDGRESTGCGPCEPPADIRVGPGEPMGAPELIWDFGWVRTGHTELEFSGAEGLVEVHYGESLDTLRVDTLNLAAGANRWRSFHRRAFRFLKLCFPGLAGEVRIRRVGLTETVYPFNPDATLETSETFLDECLQVTRRTLASSTSHHYEDCPWREQALWLVDARVMALANGYLHGDHAVTEKSLRQIFALQRENGTVPATGPRDNAFLFLDFMLHLAPMLIEHHRMTGERSLLQDLAGPLDRLSAFVDRWRNDDGLLDSTGARRQHVGIFFDWSKTLLRRGCTTILNALYVDHLRAYAACKRVLGEEKTAAELEARIPPLQEAARATFLVEEHGLFRDGCPRSNNGTGFSMQASVAAVHAGFEPEATAPGLLRRACLESSLPRPFGPSFYLFVFAAMHRVGMHGEILQWMRDYWGAMLERGATTWWEVFNPDHSSWTYPHPFLGQTPTYERPEVPVSLCHGWSCVPGFAIPRYLLGIDLSEIADGRVVWEEDVPALTENAEYRVATTAGPLHLKFAREGERYRLDVVESPLPVVHRSGSTK